MTELVLLHHSEPMTTSLAIAEGVGMEHKSVLQLIRTHVESLAEFGGVAFEMRPFETAGGQQWRDVYFLNEPQATLLITFMRNSEIVVRFKVALVKAFFAMRDRLDVPPAPTFQPMDHGADMLVSADRTFRAMLRTCRAAGLRLPQALGRANEVTRRRTGIDILAEIDLIPEEQPMAREDMLDEQLTRYLDAVAEGEPITVREIVIALFGADVDATQYRARATRLGILLQRRGYRKRRLHAYGRPHIYERPIPTGDHP